MAGRRDGLRTAPLVLGAVLLAAGSAPAQDFALDGFVDVTGVETIGRPSWLEGGFGRLAWPAAGDDHPERSAGGQVQAALRWSPSLFFGAYAHGLARAEPDALSGRAAGLVEGWVEGSIFPAGTHLRLRLGTFFPPTSRENVDALWASPYTLTLSAINTWLAEEVRLTGADVELRIGEGTGRELRLAAAPFQGNDASGALLAWRGFTLGDRLTVFDEVLPLPPLRSLADDGVFANQRDDGTLPLGRDLDGRTGWHARASFRGSAGLVQVHALDNRGDRELHRGEYAWRTRAGGVGGEVGGERWVLVGEWLDGDTGMGPASASHVQADFRAGYLLAAWRGGPLGAALRWDDFATGAGDATTEPVTEDGEAWTAAVFWEPRQDFRFGIEIMEVRADRPPLAEEGADPHERSRRTAFSARWHF